MGTGEVKEREALVQLTDFGAVVVGQEELEKIALESEKIQGLLEGKSIVKVIAVPGRLINIVVK